MIIRGVLLRVLKVFHIVKVTRLPAPKDAEAPALVIVKETRNESR